MAPVLIMANRRPAATLLELPKAAAAPGYSFGSGGPGSIGHIVGEMAKGAMKVQMTHIPYKGGAPMTTDLIAGTIPVGIDVITAYVPMMKSGQIKGLAVTSKSRSPLAPDVPTVVELGLPMLVAENYFGVSGPARLPKEVSDKLHAALDKIVADPAIVKRFEELGITPVKASRASSPTWCAAGQCLGADHQGNGPEVTPRSAFGAPRGAASMAEPVRGVRLACLGVALWSCASLALGR